MYLFGLKHKPEYLERQIAYMEAISPVTEGKVVLLELAPNYPYYVEKGILGPNFFMSLDQYFRGKGVRVVWGDQELTMPEKLDWIELVILGEELFYPDNRRDEIIRQNITTERPDIVAVASGHSDEIKRHFPDAYYTVFQELGGYTDGHHGRPHIWYKTDRIITL